MARPLTPRRGVCGRGRRPEALPQEVGLCGGGGKGWGLPRLTLGSHSTPWYAGGRGTGKMAMGHMQKEAGFERNQKKLFLGASQAAAVQRLHVISSFRVRGLIWELPPFPSGL